MNTEEQEGTQYVTNEQAMQIMAQIIDSEEECIRLKSINSSQFEKIRQKLVSNVSIVILKWYKILQDQLYNEVKNYATNNVESTQSLPQNFEIMVRQ